MTSRPRKTVEAAEHLLDTAWNAYHSAEAQREEDRRAAEAERQRIARQSARLRDEHARHRSDLRDRFDQYNADPSMDARHDLLRALGVNIPPPSGPTIDITPETDDDVPSNSEAIRKENGRVGEFQVRQMWP